MTAALDRVRATYDAMAARVAQALAGPPADPEATAEAAPLLAREARLLDARAFSDWLALYAGEAYLWLPVHPGDHPARDQALIFDDRRRLAERAAHFGDRQAWAITAPEPLTTRHLGPVEAWPWQGEILATAALTIRQVRRREPVTLVGREVLSLDRGRAGLAVTSKTLLLPDLALGTPHLGWII
jgi:3-phenylpropionate/cinnamic acid dioxygenase small subunit